MALGALIAMIARGALIVMSGRPQAERAPKLAPTAAVPQEEPITDTVCVADKPVTRAVAVDLSGAFFDRGAFPGTLVTVEQRRVG